MKPNPRFVSLFLVIFIMLIIITKFSISLQYKLIYEPSRKISWIPSSLYNYDDIMIQSKGKYNNRIHSWYFKNFPETHPVVFFCHGSRGNISEYKNIIDICIILEINIIIFDYRGYGKSSGGVSQKNILEDGLTVYDHFVNNINVDKLIIMGESLGGAVATYVASQRKCSKLILISTFDSLSGIIRQTNETSWINKIISILIKFAYNQLPIYEYIKSIKVSLLMIHSSEDDLIPIKCSKNVFDNADTHKQYITIKGTHTQPIFDTAEMIEFIQFLNIDSAKLTRIDYLHIAQLLRYRASL